MNKKSNIAKTKQRDASGKFVKRYQATDVLGKALAVQALAPGNKSGFDYASAANSTFVALPEPQIPVPSNPAVTPMAPGVYHVNNFRSIAITPGGIYRNLDEALRASTQTAKAMLNDASITGPLFQRWMSLSSYNDGCVPEDENDEVALDFCDKIQADLENIPNWTEFKKNLMWAAWYGKTCNVINWDFKIKNGIRKLAVKNWINIIGDKLVFRNNGRMGYLAQVPTGYREVVYSDRGLAELFTAEDDDCIVHHKYFITDTSWDESMLAIGIEGFGYRHYLYWTYWLKMQLLEWALNAFQIFGAGGIRIGYFEQSNPASEQAVSNALALANGSNIILFPRPIGDEKQGAGLEIVSPQGLDLSHFQHFIDDYFNKQIYQMLLGFDFDTERRDYYRLQKYDAAGLSETITNDLVRTIIKYNYPQATEMGIKYKINVPNPDGQKYMESVQRAYEISLPLSENEVYSELGFTKPGRNKKKLIKPMDTMSRQLKPDPEAEEAIKDGTPLPTGPQPTGPQAPGNVGSEQTIKTPSKEIGNLGQQLS